MRIVLVGASGTIGRAVAAELGQRHDIVPVGSRSGEVQIDITDAESIRSGLARIGACDAIVSTVGKVKFAPLAEMTEADFAVGLEDKLMGQVNLVLLGRQHLNDGGSFTLTAGVLTHDPIRAGSSASAPVAHRRRGPGRARCLLQPRLRRRLALERTPQRDRGRERFERLVLLRGQRGLLLRLPCAASRQVRR